MPYDLPVDDEDVQNLATMINVLLGSPADDIPRERLEGLAREIAAHNGDESFDTFEALERWVGEYLD